MGNLIDLAGFAGNSNSLGYRPDDTGVDKTQQSLEPTKEDIVSLARQDKMKKLSAMDGNNTDADSGNTWRLQGADAPEVYHDNTQERAKVYKQIARTNNISMDEAIKLVDAQSLATKIAKDNGYDLGAQVEEARKSGAMDANYQPTAFDIYRMGDRATNFVNQDTMKNQDTGILQSYKTGQKDVYGRDLVANKEFTDRAIQSGYMVPGANDKENFDAQTKSFKSALQSGQGLADSQVNKTLLKDLHDNSYSNQTLNPKPVYATDSDITSAAKASVGKTLAMYGDLAMDTASKVFGDGSNYTGLDEAKNNDAYWGYQQSDRYKEVQQDLAKAFQSGDKIEMGKAILGSLTKPDVIAELLAGSVGEMANSAMYSNPWTAGVALAARTNSFVEDRLNYLGKDKADFKDVAIAGSTALVYDVVNRLTGGNAGLKMIKDSAKTLVGGMTEVGLISMKDALTDISKGFGKAYFSEGSEEIIQEIAQNVNKKLSSEKQSELFGKQEQSDYFVAGALGGAAGGGAHITLDAPKKALDTYKNNKPLNDIITSANNLDQSQRDLVHADDVNSRMVAEQTINNNKKLQEEIATINQDTDLTKVSPELQQEVSTVASTKALPQFVDNTIAKVQDLISNTNEILKDPDLIDMFDGHQSAIEFVKELATRPDLDTAKLQTEFQTNPKLLEELNSYMNTMNSYGIFGDKANFNTMSKLTKAYANDNKSEIISHLQSMSKNLDTENARHTKLIQHLDFRIKEFNKASDSNTTQTKSGKDNTDFNAKTILESEKLKSRNGIDKIKSDLNEYDTESLKTLQQDLMSNHSKDKNASKLNTALVELIRMREQANRAEKFNNGNGTAMSKFNASLIALRGNKLRAMTQALRSDSITQDEANQFRSIIENMHSDGTIDVVTKTNLLNRMDKITSTTPTQTSDVSNTSNTTNSTGSTTTPNQTQNSTTAQSQNNTVSDLPPPPHMTQEQWDNYQKQQSTDTVNSTVTENTLDTMALEGIELDGDGNLTQEQIEILNQMCKGH